MSEPIDKHQWEVRAAYRLGQEVCVNYYERMVRSIMMMLEDAQNIMKVDDMSDVIRSIGKVLIELEDTWAMIALWKTEQLARRTGQSLPDRSGHDPEGAS